MNQPSAPAAHDPVAAHPFLQNTICLVGFMGAGKSTVGAALARALHRDFVDLDRMIESRTGKTVPEIFDGQGEAAFRNAEREALAKALSRSPGPQVVALGGGAFVQPEVISLLEAHGVTTIFLAAPAEELYQRCVDSLDAAPRPLLKDLPSFKKLYAERLPAYERAEWHVSTAGTPITAVVSEILQRIEARRADAPRKKDR